MALLARLKRTHAGTRFALSSAVAKLFLFFYFMFFLLLGSTPSWAQSSSDDIMKSIEADFNQEVIQTYTNEIIGYDKGPMLSGLPVPQGGFPIYQKRPIYRYQPSAVHPHPTMANVYVISVIDKLAEQKNKRLSVVKEYFYFLEKTEKGEVDFKRVETASSDEIVKNLRQSVNIPSTFMSTLKSFPQEYGKFNAAMVALEFVSCFGGSVATNFTWRASTDTPVCVDHLIKSLTTLEGNIGFFSFIYGQRISSAALTNLAIRTSTLINKPLTTQRIIALRPLVGYFGMSFGMAAQQVVSHIINLPTFSDCRKDVLSGKFSTPSCIEAANHFLSAEKFWMDFGAGLPSLIGGAIMSANTQWLIKNARLLSAKETKDALLKKGLGEAVTVFKRLRMAKNLVAVGGGPPGWLIMVGETAIFLAWTKWLEIPSTKMVWSWFDKPDIRRANKSLLDAANAVENAKGFSPKTVDVSCYDVAATRARQKQTVCQSTEYFKESLQNLQKYSKRYREKVLLAYVQRYFPDQILKLEKYIGTYTATKEFLQYIYSKRSKNPISLARESSSLLGVYDTGYIVQKSWELYFEGLEPIPYYATQLKSYSEKLTLAFNALTDAYETNSSIASMLELEFIRSLIDFKNIADKMHPFDPVQGCDNFVMDPGFCRALKSLRLVPSQASDFYNKPRESLLYTYVVELKMLDMISPISDVVRQLLCNEPKFKSSARFGAGLPATLKTPGIVKGFENDAYFAESCLVAGYTENLIPMAYGIDPEDGRYKELTVEKMTDYFDVLPRVYWNTEKMTYVDPLSLLLDPVVSLSPGLTEKDAQLWWNKQMEPEVASFYVNYVIDYKDFLERNMFYYIDRSSAPELLKKTLPGNPPPRLRGSGTQTEIYSLYKQIAQKRYLNQSLIAHLQLLTTALKKVSLYNADGDRARKILSDIQRFLVNFAEHTRHFTYEGEANNLRPVLENQIKVLISTPVDPDSINMFKFAETVTHTLFADSFKKKNERQRQLQLQLGALSEFLTGENLNKIQNIDKRLNFTAQQVAEMNPMEYRKYTILQIIQHMSLLVDETTSYYDNYLFMTGLFSFLQKQ